MAPIINAGMAFVAGPELAAAVSNAGGLGMLGAAMVPPKLLQALIAATRKMTDRPFGVDLIGEFAEDAHVDALAEARVALAVFFWSAPSPAQVARLKAAGVAFWMQVGSVEEARAAAALGAETLIVQGSEAGGHNRAEATLASLFPAVRAAVPDMPLVAAGGIVDGASMAAALMRGADAVWCGTRFLASREADAHEDYKARWLPPDPARRRSPPSSAPNGPASRCGRSSTKQCAARRDGRRRRLRKRPAS